MKQFDLDFSSDKHPTHSSVCVCVFPAGKDEFQHQQRELEKVCNPILTKFYQSVEGMPRGASSGPSIEEVD